MIRRTLAVVFVLTVLAGCGGKEAQTETSAASKSQGGKLGLPTAAEAKEILEKSPEWSDHMFTSATWTFPTSRAAMHEQNKALADQLEHAGYIRYDGDEVVLTDKGFNDKRFVMRPNNFVDIMPLAKKRLVEVTSVSEGPEGRPVVDFKWEWEPNEIGASFKSGMFFDRFAQKHEAKATLYKDGDKWGVLRIEETGSAPTSP